MELDGRGVEFCALEGFEVGERITRETCKLE